MYARVSNPARYLLFMMAASPIFYWGLEVAAFYPENVDIKASFWKIFPLIILGTGLLIQIFTMIGHLGFIQQKIFSRLPPLVALVVTFFYSSRGNELFYILLGTASLFLIFLVKKARHQKRIILKMMLFLGLYAISPIIRPLFMGIALYYYYIFQQTFGFSLKVESFLEDEELK
jgi:hypothetical protein